MSISASTIDKSDTDYKGKKGFKSGECQFPFFYKGKEMTECVEHPKSHEESYRKATTSCCPHLGIDG